MSRERFEDFGRALSGSILTAALILGAGSLWADGTSEHWVGTWAASPQLTEERNLPEPGFVDMTVRQIVHVTIGGKRLRVRFSNEFGNAPLTLREPRIAQAKGESAIDPATDHPLTFRGQTSIVIQPGSQMLSDPVDFMLSPLTNVAVTLHVDGAPSDVTGHPGSRTTSYFQKGRAVSTPALPEAVGVDHWYFVSAIDVVAPAECAAVATLGDSITDGRGSTTNGNDRWPDNLARRLQTSKDARCVAVVNHGIGGNRLLRDGLGPSALARLDRDIIAQPGIRWLIVFEGVNDIGTAVGARAKGEPAATADDIIAAYDQIVRRAHTHGILVYGATLLPFGGNDWYDSPESAADRQKVNEWIRTSGKFDAVIDFDAVTKDSLAPHRMSAAVDCGDHLHPSAAGYRIMSDSIDLSLFERH